MCCVARRLRERMGAIPFPEPQPTDCGVNRSREGGSHGQEVTRGGQAPARAERTATIRDRGEDRGGSVGAGTRRCSPEQSRAEAPAACRRLVLVERMGRWSRTPLAIARTPCGLKPAGSTPGRQKAICEASSTVPLLAHRRACSAPTYVAYNV